MLLLFQYCCFFVALTQFVNGLIQDKPMPKELYDCYTNQTIGRNITTTPSYSVYGHCLNYYLTATFQNRYYTNIDPSVITYVENLERNLHLERQKRQTRFRLRRRREIRMLSDQERQAFFNAVNTLKRDRSLRPNVYDALASLHSAEAIQSAHFGPNFLGWHRYYLYIFEEALRRVDPSVTLPYWDSRLDFNMVLDDPVTSIIWTDRFFGNGNGLVTTGPFANWGTRDNGFLNRAIGSPGSLMTTEGIQAVMSQTFHRDITQPTSQGINDLEGLHNNVHAWVGGLMSGLTTSSYDPVFFLHHCFVDYVWEQFRNQQFRRGINPQNDYPNTGVRGHWPWRRMANLGRLRNVDGFHNAFTQFIYEYEPSPTFPSCGRSVYLETDSNRRMCISTTARHFQTSPGPQLPSSNSFGAPVASMMRNNERMAVSNDPQEIAAADKIHPIFIDPRTQKKVNRLKRAVYNPQLLATKSILYPHLHNNGQLDLAETVSSVSVRTPQREFQSTFSDVRGSSNNPQSHFSSQYPSSVHSVNNLGTNGGSNAADTTMNHFSDVSSTSSGRIPSSSEENFSALFNMDRKSKTSEFIDHAIQNTFVIDGIADVGRWAFAAVRIIYRRPPGSTFDCQIIKNGQIFQGEDFYSPTHYGGLQSQVRTGNPATYPKRIQSGSGASKVFVQSDGLTYEGKYVDYAIIDERQPISETVTYVAFKNPRLGNSEAYISASDANGRVCQPRCLIPGSRPPRYKICSGVISVTSVFPKMYGDTYGDAVLNRYSFDGTNCPNNKDDDIFLTFYCDYENQWPWLNYPHYK